MTDFLHGIKTVFMDDNGQPIELLDASIGFMIGTAPNADDSVFPIGKSVLINSENMLAKLVDGTLYRGVTDVFNQTKALIVVHRVEHNDDPAILKANIIGSLDADTGTMTGLNSLLRAEQEAGKRPRLVVAPEFQDLDIAMAMEAVCKKYNAIPIVETLGTGYASHKAFKDQLDISYPIAGKAVMFDPDTASDISIGGSATALGVIIRTDNEKGFQHAPSNKIAYKIKGPELPIDYTAGDPTCMANVYNSESMAVFAAQRGGVKLWGQRLANGKKIQKERVRLLFADTVREETQDVIDGNITKAWVDNLRERIQNFGDRMVLDEVISGCRVIIPQEINISNIGLDKFYLDYVIGYYDSAEQIIYRQFTDNTFNEKVYK